MRDVGWIALVTAIGLAVVVVAVFAVQDKSVLVAPPETVTESFVRELGMARYELAWNHLAEGLRKDVSREDIRNSFEPLREQTGRPDQVVTEVSSANGDRARVLATLEGRRGTASMYVDLVRERGLWKVAAWPLDLVQRP